LACAYRGRSGVCRTADMDDGLCCAHGSLRRALSGLIAPHAEHKSAPPAPVGSKRRPGFDSEHSDGLVVVGGRDDDDPVCTCVDVDNAAHVVGTGDCSSWVAAALSVHQSRVRRRRLARTLWAINDNGAWVFPALQFDADPKTGRPYKQIRGLD